MPICDLHTHSTFSDGTLAPAELIHLAEESGIAAVALCDHNTVAGLPSFLEAAASSSVEAIPGTELSTLFQGKELHVVGLFIQPEHYQALTDLLTGLMVKKEQSNIALIEALKRADILLDYNAIKNATPNGQVNRALIAAEMVRQGYCESIKQAFSQWLAPKHGYFQPPERLDVFDAIRFLKSIGAVTILAHPFLSMDEATLREFLTRAVPLGLDAMEVYYPKFSPDETRLAESLVKEFAILPSGGSDFHGGNKPDIRLGTGLDNLSISIDILRQLESKKQNSIR